MKKVYEENDIRNIANAIREKSGSSDTYKVSEMAQAVTDIPSGGLKYFTDTPYKYDTITGNNMIISSLEIAPSFIGPLPAMGLYYVLYNAQNLIDINNLKTWNVSNCTNIANAFYSCNKLTSFSAIKDWDVSHITTFTSAFNGCSNVQNLLDLEYWNVSSAATFESMFRGCSKLMNANFLNSWGKTGLLSTATYMFSGCSNLEEIIAPNFMVNNDATSSSTNLSYMFQNCSVLKRIDLKNFKTLSSNSVNSMFDGCRALKFVDIRNVKVSNITGSVTNTLRYVPATVKIIVKDQTEKTWWQTKCASWKNCFYTPEEAIAAGIVDE